MRIERVNQIVWLIIGIVILGFFCWGGIIYIQSKSESDNQDELHESCMQRSIYFGHGFLMGKGYTEDDEGGMIDSEGNYPTSELEEEIEILQTEEYNKCLSGK